MALAFGPRGWPQALRAAEAAVARSAQFELLVPDAACEATLVLEDKLSILCRQARTVEQQLVRDVRKSQGSELASFCFSRDLAEPPVVVEGQCVETVGEPPDAVARDTMVFAIRACTDGTLDALPFEVFALERVPVQNWPRPRRWRLNSRGAARVEGAEAASGAVVADGGDGGGGGGAVEEVSSTVVMSTLPRRQFRVYVLEAASDTWKLMPSARVLKVRRPRQQTTVI